jgi:hypothetical protein
VKRLPREQLVVLGLLAAPTEKRTWSPDDLRRTGLEIKPILRKLVDRSLAEFHTGLMGDEDGYGLTEQGRLTLRLIVDGRDCEWCREPAADGCQLNRSAAWIYFCEKHREIGEASAQGEPSSRGSLGGQIRAGKIKPTTPEAVAAAQGFDP